MKDLTQFLDKYGVTYRVEEDAVVVDGDLYLDSNQLTSLPESFGNLKVGGNLYLDSNQLTSLPESFGNLKVGGNLYLHSNQLTSLPESFGNLKVGGYLYLHSNQLTSLPESFGNLKVGGNLYLSHNQLTSLPESFGNLKVGGNLYLDSNQLTSLPESFGNLKVGGYLHLGSNQLTSLPESFGNLKVGGDLYLGHNQLTSLPESFGNLKVGGNLYLHSNQLTSLPGLPRMTGNIVERDWCYIDGILREIVSTKRVGDLTVIKTHFDYIVGSGELWAHGKTIAEAKADLQFKLLRSNPEELRGLDIEALRPVEELMGYYRAITGACREGCRMWLQSQDLPKELSVKEAIMLVEGAYGGDTFAAFFTEAK